VERLADDHDGAVAVGRDEDEIPRVGRAPAGDVDLRAGELQAGLDLGAGLVVAHRGEQVDLGGRSDELEEGQAAAAAGHEARRVQVEDRPGRGQRRDPPQGHVLDVSDDCDPHPKRVRWRSLEGT
jgi:hypothetical protein